MTVYALERIRGPLASAAATVVLFTGILWLQHSRDGWPFERDTLRPTALVGVDAGATSSEEPGHGRVPVQVAAATAHDLGIALETVRRSSLTQDVRTVATIVPDESRISHVHTRV